ncbi:Bacterial membrane flanked domain protein [Tsuneonella dongtanensis]|uniref:Bacterial membrane flanked domain protein n=1 Tax=Tsuneonella dongtanensis TaxID=692370 RepID=A0A1B2AAE5_9SPHN|nr:PH domain-containing protein [Tsuneonella dongtanensis]ANY19153.1 Bacterial membrane flanked domain protein [Tsuneonella dongtanensis]
MDGDPIAIADNDRALTPLAPNHVKLLRTQAAIMTVPFVIASLVLESADLLPRGAFLAPVLLLAAWAIARVPLRRHAARGYDLGADRLRVARGLWFRSDTVVPFGRVQHIDVTQGPLERAFGLSTLVVHTAGTHNASVSLPGLATDDAAAMRETIRTHIKRETV